MWISISVLIIYSEGEQSFALTYSLFLDATRDFASECIIGNAFSVRRILWIENIHFSNVSKLFEGEYLSCFAYPPLACIQRPRAKFTDFSDNSPPRKLIQIWSFKLLYRRVISIGVDGLYIYSIIYSCKY